MSQENTKVKSRLSKPHCQWMCKGKDWRDCGEDATHFDPATTLRYCNKHAGALQGYRRLLPLQRTGEGGGESISVHH